MFVQVFKRNGLVQINPMGEKFNPNLHEALFQQVLDQSVYKSYLIQFWSGCLLFAANRRSRIGDCDCGHQSGLHAAREVHTASSCGCLQIEITEVKEPKWNKLIIVDSTVIICKCYRFNKWKKKSSSEEGHNIKALF